MEQLSIPYIRCADEIRQALERASGGRVELALTDNSSRMVSVRRLGSGYAIRLHRVFLCAPREVLSELGRFMAAGGGTALVRRFLQERRREIAPTSRRARILKARGESHDLKAAFDSVNTEYFGGKVSAGITWSRRRPGRVRARTLGSYCFASRTIRVNPVLDRALVPAFFVEFIVYHEMLHACLGPGRGGGRRSVHGAEFRKKEKEFRHFHLATGWEKANSHLL